MKKILLALIAALSLCSSMAQMPYPNGNFHETCNNDWTIVGTTLTANCRSYEDQRGGGRLIRSSLRNYDMCESISNKNGHLYCGAVKACTKLGSDGSGPRNGPCCGKRMDAC